MLQMIPALAFALLHALFPAIMLVVCLKAYAASAGTDGQKGWFNLAIGNAGHALAGLLSAASNVMILQMVSHGSSAQVGEHPPYQLLVSMFGVGNGVLELAASGFLLAGTINLAQTYCGLFQASEPSRNL